MWNLSYTCSSPEARKLQAVYRRIQEIEGDVYDSKDTSYDEVTMSNFRAGTVCASAAALPRHHSSLNSLDRSIAFK